MNIHQISQIFSSYKENYQSIDRTIHENDDMMNKSKNGWDDYCFVGHSTIELICKSLLFCDVGQLQRILDFGCGHGRVARHVRVAFPKADLWFSDIDGEAWRFCAKQFDGFGFDSDEEFEIGEVEENFDLIFLGSVFTHLDWRRSRRLWSVLFDVLAPGGALIATFRGPTCYGLMMSDTKRFNAGGYYDKVLEDYRETGFGYQDYKGFHNWGQNLVSFAKIGELSGDTPDARLACFAEAGWANIHDVGVWTKCRI